ncbi:Tol-Pal system beta propeller repeat protein TolB [Blochmannia endosymbiont of Polyrhachis (Hedomyrma) turneri]|uniref:Tol-Pal system beta propeller repeat protein TolB n=1 Tax=Blochmannia endosymbiont of Polyrhachis (Hedomyrma) turneri TaxID=1505596 RepID=UPI00061A87FA|nr:Tol-Pal system beta propeller repeat protein TolB [Blochmannia endosymbiont of Polyrhachis (Hedomyrma) turneri]AKC59907.1 Protein TolB [Blochmannia endosymbiont of Polyrhachis (Hedomyrma) turneri]
MYHIFTLLIVFFCIPSLIFAEICIDITKGINRPRPISILPFNTTNLLNIGDIAEIIAFDLNSTGKFYVLSRTEFPEQPTNLSEITVHKWLKSGNDIIVIGKINIINNNQYEIFYQLVNIANKHPNKTVILQNKYTVTQEWIRYAAHTISNDIFEKLIGISGEFCTKIAYITYVKNRQYPYRLYISDYDGNNQILVYQSTEPLMSPAWAPSGKQLAYVLFSNNRSILVLHDLNNGSIRQIVNFPRHNGAPAFSPDGKKLAFVLSKTGSLNLYIMDLSSNYIKQITNERNNNTEPSWFPDNNNLAYTSDRSGKPQIYKIDTSKKNISSKRLSWENVKNQNGKVSSDGKFLIMISGNNNAQYITKLNLLTEQYQKLTNSTLDETPTLSPSNNMIIYSTSEQSSSAKLYLISVDGRFKTCLPINDEQVRFPAWSPYIK